jgi:hypothetical protein
MSPDPIAPPVTPAAMKARGAAQVLSMLKTQSGKAELLRTMNGELR